MGQKTEGCKKDPNIVEILLSSSVESEPLCEVANPQPLVVDSGPAETVIPRTWFLKHKTVASEGSKARCVLHDGRRQHCGKPRRENADQVNSRWPQLRKVTFRVANVNKALGSVSKMVRNGNRVVFDTSGSYNKMAKDILWLRESDGVHVVCMLIAPPGREQKSKPLSRRRSMWQGL